MSDTNFKAKKRAEFINLPNIIKGKVGSGGLSDAILNKAQQLLDEHKMDFTPAAEEYLDALNIAIEAAREASVSTDSSDFSYILEQIVTPCVELHSHGTMFHFDLVSTISNKVILFLKNLDQIDEDVLDILTAYHTTIKAIILSKIYGGGGARGEELLQTLSDACDRYFTQSA